MAIPDHTIQHIWPTLEELRLASIYANDTHSDIWDFAISKQRLIQLGTTETDLRWLVKKGYLEHGREVTIEGEDGRRFQSTGNLTFTNQTFFVLSQVGIDFAQKFQRIERHSPSLHASAPHFVLEECLLPYWDCETRKLRLGDHIVKRFKWPALNQEAILCAFQEEEWSERIDDPLPPQRDQDPKRRLADTIKCLNRKQVNKLIHFRGDGTGEGIVWEQADRSNTVL